jgi:hypothetical protein
LAGSAGWQASQHQLTLLLLQLPRALNACLPLQLLCHPLTQQRLAWAAAALEYVSMPLYATQPPPGSLLSSTAVLAGGRALAAALLHPKGRHGEAVQCAASFLWCLFNMAGIL